MTQFLRSLFDELAGVDLKEVKDPSEPVKDGETYIAELDYDHRRLYVVMDRAMDARIALAKSLLHRKIDGIEGGIEKDPDFRAAMTKLRFLAHRAEALHQLFWASIERTYSETIESNHSIRKDWKLVRLPEAEAEEREIHPSELPISIILMPLPGSGIWTPRGTR